jgi:hypothetical protein
MDIVTTIITPVFVLILVAVVLWCVRMFTRAVRRGPGLPYQPVRDPNTPPPVEPTSGVALVGVIALTWAVLHVAAAAWWGTTGYQIDLTLKAGVVAAYVCAAGVVTAIGGVMLLGGRPYGRRWIAMGQFLFALATYMGMAVAMLLPRDPELPLAWREAAYYVAGLLFVHIVIDTAIGAAAQHVGIPADYTAPTFAPPRPPREAPPKPPPLPPLSPRR